MGPTPLPRDPAPLRPSSGDPDAVPAHERCILTHALETQFAPSAAQFRDLRTEVAAIRAGVGAVAEPSARVDKGAVES